MASPTRRRVALITLTALAATLLGAGIRLVPALAVNNPAANLQVTPELAFGSSAAGPATITLTARLDGASAGTPIAWEVEGGPSDIDGATTESPDAHCTADSNSSCTISLVSAGAGSGLVRAWVDPDATAPPSGTNEADLGEGRLSDATPFASALATNQSDCRDDPSTSANEDTPNRDCFSDTDGKPLTPQPGHPEPDGTDVVRYTFSGAAARLDCHDTNATNGTDSEVDPTGANEVITCTVTDGPGNIVPGSFVDGENVGNTDGGINGFGANDPDNSATGTGPDYDTTDSSNPVSGSNACTTGGNGTCTVTIDGATEGQSGPAYVCFWIDFPTTGHTGGDATVTPNTVNAAGNGGECGPNELVNEQDRNDSTDTVRVQWASGGPTASAVEVAAPDSPVAAAGGSINLATTVYDQFGDYYAGGTAVVAEYFGGSTNDTDGNAPASADRACNTGATSDCTITITSAAPGTDRLCVWVVSAPTMAGDVSNGTCNGEDLADPSGPATGVNNVDVVQALWTGAGSGGTSQDSSKTQGYVLVGSDGGIFTFGTAQFKGSLGDKKLNQPIIGIAYKPGGTGYWLVAKDGGVFTFGDANFYGSTGDRKLNAPVLGMEATPDGGGYWLFAADGGIFTFGNAKFFGSTGDRKLNAPMVGMAVTSAGNGYWLVAQDGGIFTFNAPFYGSTGDRKLNQPVFDMAVAKGDSGYWLVARDGGVFTFGPGTPFYGSGVGNVTGTVIGMGSTPSGGGYWIADSNGKVVPFGDAASFGDRSGRTNNAAMVAFATVRPA
jgi:hypothetical protein